MTTSPDRRNSTTHSTAHYFLEGLTELGIEYLFCNFGTDHAPIIEEMARWEKAGRAMPKIVVCAHENVGAHMAAGYALATGRGQAVLVHVDAGTANSAMALHNIFRSRLPVMLMAGTAPFTSYGELTGSRDTYVHFVQQPFDQGSLVRPYVKWEYTLPSGVTAKETLSRAHAIMESEPKGPVYLMLPRETLTQDWDESAVRSYPVDQFGPSEASGADPELVQRLATRLLAAKSPLLITAYGGRSAAGAAAIDRLARFAGIRIVEFLSIYNVLQDSPCFGGFQHGKHLAAADLGLMVDVDVPWIPTETEANPATYWAQVDIDVLKGASPMWSFPGNLRIQGDSGRILTQLVEMLEAQATPAFRAEAAKRVEALAAEGEERKRNAARLAADKGKSGQISPHWISAALAAAIEPTDIVVNEAIRNAGAVSMQIPRPLPLTMIKSGGGGLGSSGGTALGLKLAKPDAIVIQIVGDGSFYFNNPAAVLATSKQYGLPLFTIVFDNTGWSAVKQATLRVYPKGEAQDIGAFQAQLAPDMDFAKIAEAAGAYGEKLVDPDEVPAAIARCLEAVRGGRSAVLHACVTKL
ncbi:MAG: acetolactate synthase [Rhodospirillales bacterium]|jgi:acetolactate synthase-1/2/3 large subunit|nr:acetolactate synthase [Rhodospirillales bacterium]